MKPKHLKMKTTSTFETLENNHPNTQRHTSEDQNPTIYGLFKDAMYFYSTLSRVVVVVVGGG